MRVSDKKRSEMYDCISEPIMDLRLGYSKARPLDAEELDAALFRLQNEIWRRLHKTLKLDGPA